MTLFIFIHICNFIWIETGNELNWGNKWNRMNQKVISWYFWKHRGRAIGYEFFLIISSKRPVPLPPLCAYSTQIMCNLWMLMFNAYWCSLRRKWKLLHLYSSSSQKWFWYRIHFTFDDVTIVHSDINWKNYIKKIILICQILHWILFYPE